MNSDSPKSLQAMQKFAETYAQRTNTFFCSDLSVTSIVIEGLARHKDEYGAPLCPCRHYDDKSTEVSVAYWNCPCVPMRERKEVMMEIVVSTTFDAFIQPLSGLSLLSRDPL